MRGPEAARGPPRGRASRRPERTRRQGATGLQGANNLAGERAARLLLPKQGHGGALIPDSEAGGYAPPTEGQVNLSTDMALDDDPEAGRGWTAWRAGRRWSLSISDRPDDALGHQLFAKAQPDTAVRV